mgnify:CR=1 FL=1
MTKVMKSPKSVDILFTSRCNLSCKYCSNSTGDIPEDLPVSEWIQFIEELGRNSVLNIGIGGGEPFIRDDLTELIESIVKNRMRYTIVSNGSLITESIASFIASTGRCDSIQISIDGSHSQPHDVFRGKGSFYGAISGLECLRKQGIAVGVRVTIHRKNVTDLDNIAQFLLDDLKLPRFSTNAASFFGECRMNSEEVQLTVADRVLAMNTLLRLSDRYSNRISASAGPLAEARRWHQMEMARQTDAVSFPGAGCLSACGGVYSLIAVRSDGIIIPCSQMTHIELGRINHSDFRETWQYHPYLERLRNRVATPLSDFQFCKGCEYIPYCRGNCPALAYTLTGEENHPSPDACLKRFLESGGSIPALLNEKEAR